MTTHGVDLAKAVFKNQGRRLLQDFPVLPDTKAQATTSFQSQTEGQSLHTKL